MGAESGQSSFKSYYLSSDDEEYWTHNIVAAMTSEWHNDTPCGLTATRLCLNSLPEAVNNWVQVIPNVDNYHSDPMEISSTLWILDITNWWPR
jgi:hypothetical protein